MLSNIPGRSVVISDTHTFSPTLVNEAKLGFNRTFSESKDYNFGVDVQSQLGIQGIDNPDNDPAIASMPQFSFGGAIPIAASTGRNQAYTAQNTYQIIDNVSWFKSRHNIKFGVDIRRLQVNNQNKPLTIRGSYTFDDRLTGLGYANFLLGLAWPRNARYCPPERVSSQHLLGLLHSGRLQAASARHAQFRSPLRVSDSVGGEVRPHVHIRSVNGQHGDRGIHDSHRPCSASRGDAADPHGGRRRSAGAKPDVHRTRTTSVRVSALPSAHSAMRTPWSAPATACTLSSGQVCWR